MTTENKPCHGCCGKGWVENSKGDLKLCPVCNGCGKIKNEETHIKWYPYYPCQPYSPCPEQYPLVTYCNATTQSTGITTR